MGNRWLLVLAIPALLVVGLSRLGAAEPATSSRPNILLIVADDLGWADVGYHGARIQTPQIDRLAREGVELDCHYVQPVCTPTRAALLTGRWPSRFGPHVLVPNNLRALPPGTVTLASALKSVGYTTCLAGKWHLGAPNAEWGPNAYGFDHSYGSLCGAIDPWTHQYRPGPLAKSWHRDGRLIDEEGNATELVARQAVEWIRHSPRPWFVYVPFQAVHIPIDAPESYKRIYEGCTFFDDPAKDESYHRYAAFVSQLDAKIGELIEALEATGQRSNTLVVFFSDNGATPGGDNPYVSSVPPTPALGSNLPLRGNKASVYEGGIRVVACAEWPGRLARRKLTAPLHAVDWMPTLSKLAGYVPKEDLQWDGQDIWPLLEDRVERAEPRTIYIPARGARALRHGDWKLIQRDQGKDQNKIELYNLAEDPHEQTDLAAAEPQRVEKLLALLAEVRRHDRATLPDDLAKPRAATATP